MSQRACPDDDVVARLSEGRASDRERREIEQHIDDCPACRALIIELVGRSSHGRARGSSAPPRDHPAIEPGDRVGRYPILGLLGAGAMGAVYRAHDAELDRTVAIKVLLPTGAAARTRLRDEARLLARVSHPNVVAVYEIGEWNTLDFVVMEYVEGATVADWLRAAPRTWREIVEVFVAAGRGLAAAHDAQLVHRDIKPRNLLIGSDGRVRVGDFGLARLAGEAETEDGAATPRAIAGTPAYLAPELRDGGPADARSDQYAFCVALHEGLFAVRPDATTPAPRRRMPRRIRRAVQRGLHPDPSQRFAAMHALLAALARRAPRRRMVAATAGVALVAAAWLGWQLARDPVDRCDGDARLTGAWGEPQRAIVRAAFLVTGRGYASSAFDRVEHQLDDYGRQWRLAYRRACEASHVRGEQSEALLDRRMQCLRWRRDELAQLVTVLATRLDDDVMARAITASQSLSAIASCDDVHQLSAMQAMPTDPQRAAAIEALDRELAAVIAQARAGKYADGLAASTALLSRARAAGYLPLVARALAQHAELQTSTGDAAAAEATLREAAATAAQAGDVARVASIWVTLLDVVGVKRGRPDQAWSALGYAEAGVALAGGGPELRAALLDARADLLAQRGEFRQAGATHLEARALQRSHGGSPLAQARTEDGLCRSLRMAGDWHAADAHCLEAMQLSEQIFGADHPQHGVALVNRASMLGERGEFTAAHDLIARALALFERAYPPDHPRIVAALNNLGVTLEREEKYREALPYARRVLALRERHPDQAAQLATALGNLGALEEHVGDHRAAAAHFGRALELQLAALEPDHGDILLTLVGLGQVAIAAHDPATARRHLERAVQLGETSLGKTHPLIAQPLELLATMAADRGDLVTAVALLERAAALPELAPAVRGYLHFELADALWRAGRDRRRARTLAGTALTELAAPQTAEVTAWLRDHR